MENELPAWLGVAYSGEEGTYNIVFKEFTDAGFPRSYSGDATFALSNNGTSIIDGGAYAQKRIFAVSGYLSKADAIAIDNMFKDWDAVRATGAATAVGIQDDTFNPVFAECVISTPPQFTYIAPNRYLVSIGFTEV